MFPTQSKVNRISRLWLLPVVALAMLLVGYAVFAATSAQAQTPQGDICIEGIVIDWEENPLSGWVITLTSDISGFVPITTESAMAPDDDDDDSYDQSYNKGYGKKNNYPYPEGDDELQKGEFKFSEEDLDPPGTAGVQAGTYTATIGLMPGWEGVTPTTLVFNIEDGEDDCVRIRFKVRRVVGVSVIKIDADHEPLGDWIIRAVPGPGNLFASPQEETTAVTDTAATTGTVAVSAGEAAFTLTPGLWIFTEQAPKQDMDDPQNAYRPIVPPNGRQELFIPDPEDLAVTDTFTLVFKNELVTGCFIVVKTGLTGDPDSPVGSSFNVAGWGFKLLQTDGTVVRQGVTDGRGRLRFDNLPLGPYVIVEEDRAGWDEITARRQELTVTGNDCDPGDLPVTFENEQDNSGFCIEGRKIDALDGWGIAGWEIEIEALDEGGALPVDDPNFPITNTEVSQVVTDGLGKFRFDFEQGDYRVPGGLYEVCEQEMDGWLAHTPTCQTVRLPEWPGACVQLEDFVNQQVGHSESEKHDDHGGEYDKSGQPDDYNKGGDPNGGPNQGDPNQQGGPSQQSGPSQGDPNQGGQSQSGPSQGGQYQNDSQPQCSSYHEVKAGEGLYDIGKQYGKTPQQMLDANPSVRQSEDLYVYVGQRICIP